jgi:hypothetical protein
MTNDAAMSAPQHDPVVATEALEPLRTAIEQYARMLDAVGLNYAYPLRIEIWETYRYAFYGRVWWPSRDCVRTPIVAPEWRLKKLSAHEKLDLAIRHREIEGFEKTAFAAAGEEIVAGIPIWLRLTIHLHFYMTIERSEQNGTVVSKWEFQFDDAQMRNLSYAEASPLMGKIKALILADEFLASETLWKSGVVWEAIGSRQGGGITSLFFPAPKTVAGARLVLETYDAIYALLGCDTPGQPRLVKRGPLFTPKDAAA